MKELIHFKDQNLNLDYLTLNIPNSVGRISEFADIFFRYGFNSKVFYVATNESQTILEDKKLFHTLTFILLDLRVILGTKKQCLFNFQATTLVVYIF